MWGLRKWSRLQHWCIQGHCWLVLTVILTVILTTPQQYRQCLNYLSKTVESFWPVNVLHVRLNTVRPWQVISTFWLILTRAVREVLVCLVHLLIISITFLFIYFLFILTDKDEVGSVSQVEMLHRTNLIAIVGKKFSPVPLAFFQHSSTLGGACEHTPFW